ncbi:MAG: tRNA-(ms[2]io[6]A)-hydroxylase [Candidatus Kapaibacteriota bacterium]
MLCLLNNTRPEWVNIAAADINTLLIDHAHCEKKAAANAMSMIQRYPEHEDIVREMINILKEEWEHFERVYDRIRDKQNHLTKDRGDEYAKRLSKHIRKQEPDRMLDLLLVDALIEARSCERFSLLAKSPAIPEDLRIFYKELFASEAGHYKTFTDLARAYFPANIVKDRLHELATIEAAIIETLGHQPTMHG